LDEKARAFENLKGFVERGEVDIPRDPPRLLAQMRSLEFEATAMGIKIHGAHGSADDYAHAFAYAVWPFRQGEIWDRQSIVGTAQALSNLSDIAAGGSPSAELLNRLEVAHRRRWGLP
jgi:hypothetical protein